MSAHLRAADFIASAHNFTQADAALVMESPRPLHRDIGAAEPFPVEALGSVIGRAAVAVTDRIQCPPAIASMSALAVAALAVQAHADVIVPATSHAKPVSLFLATIAATGERKSASDREVQRAVSEREIELRKAYEIESPAYLNSKQAWEAARDAAVKQGKGNRDAIQTSLSALGRAPIAPLSPILTCPEPTFEGLCRLFQSGMPSLGIFTDEGGAFTGSHGMNPDNRLRTVTGLSSLWDGSPIKRIRVGDGATVMPGRRLSMHLMMQPDVAAGMLSDPSLRDQGFLSRLLVCAPASNAGRRLQRVEAIETGPDLHRFKEHFLDVLRLTPQCADGRPNELTPREIRFAPAAINLWRAMADHVEKLLAPGGEYEPIRGLANKLPEHAARLAAVLALSDNIEAQSIDAATLERGIALSDHFASEALRVFDASSVKPEIEQARKLLAWLQTGWPEDMIGLKAIYQRGPNSIRDAATAKRAVAILEEHGWLRRQNGDCKVAGMAVREAWKINREAA